MPESAESAHLVSRSAQPKIPDYKSESTGREHKNRLVRAGLEEPLVLDLKVLRARLVHGSKPVIDQRAVSRRENVPARGGPLCPLFKEGRPRTSRPEWVRAAVS